MESRLDDGHQVIAGHHRQCAGVGIGRYPVLQNDRDTVAALAVQTAIITTVFTLSVLVGANAGKMHVPASNIVAANVSVGLLGLAVGTITPLLGAVTGKHSITMAVAALVALIDRWDAERSNS
jgi:hypothetical protein